MGNFWKYNDRVSTGAGVTGLDTADGGDAIADNEIIRGDGTTGIQGGVLTSADHNGDITGPTASTDTTVAGSDFANQPSNDSITVVSSDAGDTAITVTLIGTTTATDTVVVEDLALDGTDATTPVVSVKVDWGQLLAVKVTGTTAGTLTLTETSGAQTITTLAPAATSKGVDTGSISCWNRVPYVVASGASTKQIGLKGTNSAGATIYDSQALTGTTSVLMNSAFVTVTEYYVGDLESTRTATITAQAGVGIATITGTSANGNVTIDPQGTGVLAVDNLSMRGNTVASTNTNGAIELTPNGTGRIVVGGGAANGALVGVTGGIRVYENATSGNRGTFEGAAFTTNGYFLVSTTASLDASGLRLGSAEVVSFSSNTDYNGTPDIGLARSAAGVVKVTDGSTGDGSIRVAVGSAAAPSFAFDDDTGTGIYRQAAGKVGLAGNGQAGPFYDGGAFRFDFNGNQSYGFSLRVEANTAGVGSPNILVGGESGLILTNEGTTAENYHTLPGAAAGFVFTFIVQDADGLRVVAAGGDTIRVIDKVTAAAGYISSTTIGSTVTLTAINGTEWVATSIKGVWTDGTFTYDDTGLTSP